MPLPEDNRADLMKTKQGWMIHWLSGPERDRAIQAFATPLLPLPFTSAATSMEVIKAMRTMHPGATFRPFLGEDRQ